MNMGAILPPTDLSGAQAMLSIVSDPKAAQERLDALRKATEEATAVADAARAEAANVEKDRKWIAAERAELKAGQESLSASIADVDATVTALAQQEQALAARKSEMEAAFRDREAKVKKREANVEKLLKAAKPLAEVVAAVLASESDE